MMSGFQGRCFDCSPDIAPGTRSACAMLAPPSSAAKTAALTSLQVPPRNRWWNGGTVTGDC